LLSLFRRRPSRRALISSLAVAGAGAGVALSVAATGAESPAVRAPLPPLPSATTLAQNPAQMAVAYAIPVVKPLTDTAAAPLRHAQAGARELDCLTQAVYFEARGESAVGQAAVAQVVLNRVRHPAFPKTVCGVVHQGVKGRGCQFSFTCDGRAELAHERNAWSRAQKVAARALAGAVIPQVGGATHFHVASLGPQWPGMLRVSQVGVHVFYRFAPPGTRKARAEAQKVEFTKLADDPLAEPSVAPAPVAEVSAAAQATAAVDKGVDSAAQVSTGS
jgi:spore germination cell wall hydrolase CwlJ-like protein